MNLYKPIEDFKVITVGLGEEFTLHKNQIAYVKNEDLQIKINQFIGKCPDNMECFWAGAPELNITQDNKTEALLMKSNILNLDRYRITIIDTDMETYVKLKVQGLTGGSK